MKRSTFIALAESGEINAWFLHQGLPVNKNVAPLADAKFSANIFCLGHYIIIAGLLAFILTFNIKAFQFPERDGCLPIGHRIGTILLFTGVLFVAIGGLNQEPEVGARLEDLCKLFKCNFGQLAAMTFEERADKARTQFAECVYAVVYNEHHFGVDHPLTVVTRNEMQRVRIFLTELEMLKCDLEAAFAKAEDRYKDEHPSSTEKAAAAPAAGVAA